jgi:type I restriction enzyme M protein
MARSRKKSKNNQILTTSQQLSSIIKSARDIMRKDKGLNGDLDRLPMLTWIMFLKFLDDMEDIREHEAKIAKKRFRPAIEPPYRWRDWAAKEDGITGKELIAFINQDEAVRPDGERGPGLFAYLRSLQSANGTDRRDVIAAVFRGVINRMINGYLLRDVINKVNGIHFSSSEEIHTLGFLYESMLKEMRDSAGDSGEFYTPRPVVKFMVEVTNPQLGETILDPACGTGGFLAETYTHLEKQCKTVQNRKTLQGKSIFGGEAKPLPFMLGQMNLLLHGLEYPQITYDNSLKVRLSEIGDKDRVDIILTNPPFGGEEEPGIQNNFPDDKRTSETALLFLQLIMRKLKRIGRGSDKGGRAGMVVPNGTLFGDGVCARIKEELIKSYNLHTIVRLPMGVFSPYTDIPTNLLFFDRSGPTEQIWYYENPLPEERQKLKNPKYTKSKPLQYAEFTPLLEWWNNREENEFAWKVKAEDIIKYDEEGNLLSTNLDIKNPNTSDAFEHVPPEQLLDSILEKENRIAEIVSEIRADMVPES